LTRLNQYEADQRDGVAAKDDKMIAKTILAILMVIVICGASADRTEAEDRNADVQQAIKATDAWLKLLDDGKYRESWEQAASFFKEKVTAEEWEKMAHEARAPLGALLSRKFKLAAYATALPGAPSGQYVVIEYDASYANNKSVIDKVTPMLDDDGQWRVSGYWIQ
jgi:hypothetical protein